MPHYSTDQLAKSQTLDGADAARILKTYLLATNIPRLLPRTDLSSASRTKRPGQYAPLQPSLSWPLCCGRFRVSSYPSTCPILFIDVSPSAPFWQRQTQFGAQPIRGVNIGGWLILEPWITPSIFQQFPRHSIVDEFTLCQQAPNAQQILQSHWSSWVGLADFQKIAAWLQHRPHSHWLLGIREV